MARRQGLCNFGMRRSRPCPDIDEVRFPITVAGTDAPEAALPQLNGEDGTPTDTDIDELAQQVYQGLWWHLAEG